MSSVRRRKIYRNSSAINFQKLPWLCRRLWRNSHMSDKVQEAPRIWQHHRNTKNLPNGGKNNSSAMVRYGYTRDPDRPKVSEHQNKLLFTHVETREQRTNHEIRTEISDDEDSGQMDYIIFPSHCDLDKKEMSTNSPQKSSSSALLRKQIEGRRPLFEHRKALGNTESVPRFRIVNVQNDKKPFDASLSLDEADLHNSPRTSTRNPPVNDDDCVQFVKEIRTPPKSSPRKLYAKKATSSRRGLTPASKNPVTSHKVDNRSSKLDALKVATTNNNAAKSKEDCNKRTNHIGVKTISCIDAECSSEDIIIKTSPSKNLDISINSVSSAMEISEQSCSKNDSNDDDDIIVVQSENDQDQEIDYPTLKRSIISMVSNFIEENPGNKITLQYILQRLKALYHKDFSDRINEIKCCIRRAIERYQSQQKMLREVRPGVRKFDLATLYSENWLNDIIINQYMSILTRKKNYGAISSFWHEELLRGKEPSLPENWQTMKCILAPTCVGSHWSLLCYYPQDCNVLIYSSLTVCENEAECGFKLQKFFNEKRGKEGTCLVCNDLPQQENEHDCGVYVCMFARCVVCGNTFDILPQQVCEFRKWLKKEIVEGQLFGNRDEESSEDDDGNNDTDDEE